MNTTERVSKLVWYRRKSGKYEMKERPKSWHAAQVGNYRPLNLRENVFQEFPKVTKRLSHPPTPPIRSSTTKLQTMEQQVEEANTEEENIENEGHGRLNENDTFSNSNNIGEIEQNLYEERLTERFPDYIEEDNSRMRPKKRIQPIITL